MRGFLKGHFERRGGQPCAAVEPCGAVAVPGVADSFGYRDLRGGETDSIRSGHQGFRVIEYALRARQLETAAGQDQAAARMVEAEQDGVTLPPGGGAYRGRPVTGWR